MLGDNEECYPKACHLGTKRHFTDKGMDSSLHFLQTNEVEGNKLVGFLIGSEQAKGDSENINKHRDVGC